MSNPGPDPLPRLAEALVAVSGQLRDIGTEIATLRIQQPQPAPQVQPQPQSAPPYRAPQYPGPQYYPQYAAAPPPTYFPPPPPNQPPPNQPPPNQPLVNQPLPNQPLPTYPRPQHRMPQATPMVARTPGPTVWERLSREGAGAKLLAWIGGGVTLAGVVLLLVLAVQRGYIGPLPRIVLGGALGAVLVGIGLFLHRTPSGRVGALAVAGTGFAGLFFDVVAATAIYDYLPAWAGLVAGLGVAAAAVAVAARWDSELLAVFAVAGCVVTAPVLTGGFVQVLLIGFLLVLQIAAAPVHLARRWTTLALVASIPPVLALAVQCAVVASTGRGPDATTVLLLCLLATVVQLAVATATALRSGTNPVVIGLLLSAPVPTLLGAALAHHLVGAGAVGGVALLLALLWAAQRARVLAVPATFGLAAGAGASVAAFEAVCLGFAGDVRTAALLGSGALLAVLAQRMRLVQALVPAVVFAAVGVLTGLEGPLALDRLVRRPLGEVTHASVVSALVAGVLLVAAVLALAWACGRLLGDDPQDTRTRWTVAGFVALYGATVSVLSIGLAISPDERGFLIGHVLVTVSWTVAALVLLLRHVDSTPLRVAGLSLVGAAVVKLVVFDLASLDGIPRVLSFLGAGLVLLAAGARYAGLVADRSRGTAS